MNCKSLFKKSPTGMYAADEQTGKVFPLQTEAIWDVIAAIASVVYLMVMLGFLGWLFIDTATGRLGFLKYVFGDSAERMQSQVYRIIAYTMIGGGIGGVVNGARSILVWHSERGSFGWRHIWKYLMLPWLGATLSVMVYTITRSGIGVLGGDFAVEEDFVAQATAAFAIGSLSGYGSHKVFKWLDKGVNKLFSTGRVTQIQMPDLTGKTEEEAGGVLQKLKLNMGRIYTRPITAPAEEDKVVAQNPPANTVLAQADYVDITIGRKE